MKHFLFLISLFLLIGCSGSDDGNTLSQPDTNNFFKVNGMTYPLTHALVHQILNSNGDYSGFALIISNGSIVVDDTPALIRTQVVSNDVTQLAVFGFDYDYELNQLPTGTFNYNQSGKFIGYSIADNVTVNNEEISSMNIISNTNDLVNNEGRVIITMVGDIYNVNFNLVTTLGLIQGQYTGAITKKDGL